MPPDQVNLLLEKAAAPLAGCYLLCAAANLVAAADSWRRARRAAALRTVGLARQRKSPVFGPTILRLLAGLWLVWALAWTWTARCAWQGRPLELPETVKHLIDAAMHPTLVFLGVLVGWVLFYLLRRWLVLPAAGWLGVNLLLGWLALSLPDPQFAAIVAAPDNVAIVLLGLLLLGCMWLGAAQGVENDRRRDRGKPPVEKVYQQKVLVWPDLVYAELICAVLVTAGLLLWSLAVPAPLEAPADPTMTPNPAKAPWYFVGLQELLVYSDAWYAGVVVPTLAVFGLAALPYLDINREGSGYYSIQPRRFAWLVFHFGFVQMWVLMILVGALLRGPNWTLYGLYEPRDPARVEVLAGLRLSDWFWSGLLGRGVPQVSPQVSALARAATILWREIAGLVLLAGWFVGIPWLLSRTLLKRMRLRIGRGRYWLMMVLLGCMLLLPLKMILRWTLGLTYIVSFPEWSLSL